MNGPLAESRMLAAWYICSLDAATVVEMNEYCHELHQATRARQSNLFLARPALSFACRYDTGPCLSD